MAGIFAHGLRVVPHLHLPATHDKFEVRQGQPRLLPSFRLVLQADLQVQYDLFGSPCSMSSVSLDSASCGSDSAIFRGKVIDRVGEKQLHSTIQIFQTPKKQ